jgi:nitroreductase
VCNFDAEKCRQLFTFADNEEPAVLIPIGYAADEPKEKNRKSLQEICK